MKNLISIEYKPNNFGEIFYFLGKIKNQTDKAICLEFNNNQKEFLWIPKNCIKLIAENQYQFKFHFTFDKRVMNIVENNILNAG